jgi:uncharacterized membrane protein
MASSTHVVTHLYDTYDHAASIVRDLEAAGIASADISILANRGDDAEETMSGAGTGATLGAAVGAGAGLLAGLGLMAIPGIGPIVAAGWLASTAVGAATGLAAGGIIGSLTDLGVSEDDAHVYAEGIRRGGTLVSVRTSSVPRTTVVAIMNKYTPVDAVERAAEYRKEGWNRFEDRAEALADRDRDRDRDLRNNP